MASDCTDARCAGRISRSRRWTTTSRPPRARSPIRPRAPRWKPSRRNAKEFDITLYPWGGAGQGIVHVIGPEMGYTKPGMTIVCGDSHTSTHGAFGALAFGIGTSEVEHVLATQTLPQAKAKTMAVTVDGELPAGCSAKDVILAIINRIGTGGGVGHVIEYRGSTIRALSMEGRMTICNMSIEAGARAGMVAPDDTHVRLRRRPTPCPRRSPTGSRRSTTGARCPPTREPGSTPRSRLDATTLRPYVSWGTNPATVGHDRRGRPRPRRVRRRAASERPPGVRSPTWTSSRAPPIRDIRPDTIFIGSCTNSRIEDLRRRRRRGGGSQRRSRSARARRSRERGGQAPGGEGGSRPGVHRGRVRVARRRLLDVSRHEPGHPGAGSIAAPPRATGTSRGVRAREGARISSAPPSRRRPPIAGSFTTPEDL